MLDRREGEAAGIPHACSPATARQAPGSCLDRPHGPKSPSDKGTSVKEAFLIGSGCVEISIRFTLHHFQMQHMLKPGGADTGIWATVSVPCKPRKFKSLVCPNCFWSWILFKFSNSWCPELRERQETYIFQFSPWHHLPVDSRGMTKLAHSLPRSPDCIQREGESKQVVKSCYNFVFYQNKVFVKETYFHWKRIFSLKIL